MSAYSGNYITQRMLENRLSAAVVRRILDDDNLGSVGNEEDSPLGQLIKDSEIWFESVAICVYPDLASLRADGGEMASSLVLNCAHAVAAQRFPRAVNREWSPLWDMADKQLMRLRKGEIKLPVVGPPNPPANTGGQVELHGPHCVDTDNEPVWNNGTGIF